jgi:hypothetical protein
MKVGDKFTGFKFNGDDYSCGYSEEYMDDFIGVEGVIYSLDDNFVEVKFPTRGSTWYYPIEKLKQDPIVETVVTKFQQRSEAGIKKYGTTLDRNDLTEKEWFTHLQEELMDATLYVERILKALDERK